MNKQIEEKKKNEIPFKIQGQLVAPCSLVRGSRLKRKGDFRDSTSSLLSSTILSFLFSLIFFHFSLFPYLTFLTSSKSEIFISSTLFSLIPCQAALPVSIFSLKVDIFTFISPSRRSFITVEARIKSQELKSTLRSRNLTRHEDQAVLSSPILNFGPLS